MIEVQNNHSAFLRGLLGNTYVDQPKPERYRLSGYLDGFAIYDGNQGGLRIATFAGAESWPRASKLLRSLKEEAGFPEPARMRAQERNFNLNAI